MVSEKRVRQISPDSGEFVGFRPVFQISPKSLLMAFGKNKSQLRVFWEKVYELKEIEILGGLIEKTETLIAELKIAANFRG
jgi:hypothetical protein